MKKAIPIGIALAVFAGIVLGIYRSRPVPEVALRYRLLFPADHSGDREEATREARTVAERRLLEGGVRGKVEVEGTGVLALRLSDASGPSREKTKRLLRAPGRLGLHASAPREMQERFNRDRVVPPGYKAWDNLNPLRDAKYEHLSGNKILFKDKPVIEGRDIKTADPSQRWDMEGMQWVVSFELRNEGAGLFDEAAARLFDENPRGLIAIVLDDVLVSNPIVNAPQFGGYGVITGNFREQEAADLAAVLRSGALPVPLGGVRDGVPVPGEPESEHPPK